MKFENLVLRYIYFVKFASKNNHTNSYKMSMSKPFKSTFIIEGLHAKRAYIEFWLIFIFCRIELIFGRLTCFDMESNVP